MANNYEYTQNRELSWLKFNERVLEEAADASVPLLERVKFIAIFTSNLDEFYMVRCGSLYDLSILDEEHIDNKSGMNAQQQLQAIYRETKKLYLLRDTIYKNVRNELKAAHPPDPLHASDERGRKAHPRLLSQPGDAGPFAADHRYPSSFPAHGEQKAVCDDPSCRKEEELYGLIPVPDTLPRTFVVSKETAYG